LGGVEDEQAAGEEVQKEGQLRGEKEGGVKREG